MGFFTGVALVVFALAMIFFARPGRPINRFVLTDMASVFYVVIAIALTMVGGAVIIARWPF